MSLDITQLISQVKSGEISAEVFANRMEKYLENYNTTPDKREKSIKKLKKAALRYYYTKIQDGKLQDDIFKTEDEFIAAYKESNFLTKTEAIAQSLKSFNAGTVTSIITTIGNIILILILVMNGLGT